MYMAYALEDDRGAPHDVVQREERLARSRCGRVLLGEVLARLLVCLEDVHERGRRVARATRLLASRADQQGYESGALRKRDEVRQRRVPAGNNRIHVPAVRRFIGFIAGAVGDELFVRYDERAQRGILAGGDSTLRGGCCAWLELQPIDNSAAR
jgi:hypothetical protein